MGHSAGAFRTHHDFRVGQHFTLRQRPLTREHLQEFVDAYRPGEPRSSRQESERFRPFSYDELIARDKVNLDLSWLRDPSLDGADELLPPEVIAQEIVEDLQVALAEFSVVAEALQMAKSGRAPDVVPDGLEAD
jgi:type I restriction enzyme M protein